MRRNQVIFFLCMLTICFSCSKKTTTPAIPVNNPASMKLSKISFDYGMYDSLYYNNDGSICRLIFHTELPTPYDDSYVYDYSPSGKLMQITQFATGDYYAYSYTGELLSRVDHYVKGNKTDYDLYEFTDGKLSRINEYYALTSGVAGFELLGRRDFFYYTDGNEKQELSYYFNRQTQTMVRGLSVEYLDYDSKSNPTDPIYTFPYQPQIQMAKNNPGRVLIVDSTIPDITDYSYQYTYNSSLHPLTRKATYLHAGQLQTELLTYHYY